jgi:hypothetical protein
MAVAIRTWLVFVSVVSLAIGAEPNSIGRPGVDPLSDYETRTLQGFHVRVNKRLFSMGDDSAKIALTRLDDKLAEALRLVPVGFHPALRDAQLWVEEKGREKPRPGNDAYAAYYVPVGRWDFKGGGVIPQKEGGVEIPAVTWLLEPNGTMMRAYQNGWLMHELAHSLHDRILGLEHWRVKAAYRQAIDRHLYDAVSIRQYDDDGGYDTRPGPAYARTNHIEYFAELSVAYFGLSRWSFPFSREELKAHDPEGFALMESFWQDEQYHATNHLGHAVFVYGAFEAGRKIHMFNLDAGEKRTFSGWPHMRLTAAGTLGGNELEFGALPGGALDLRAR